MFETCSPGVTVSGIGVLSLDANTMTRSPALMKASLRLCIRELEAPFEVEDVGCADCAEVEVEAMVDPPNRKLPRTASASVKAAPPCCARFQSSLMALMSRWMGMMIRS